MQSAQASILVIGSSNTDMVVKTATFPRPGQTVLGGSFLMNPGGKGANQAVAAARLGARVTFVSKLGKDIFGTYMLEALKRENIDCRHIIKADDQPSGVALITVNEEGENNIVVASGANMRLGPEEINEQLMQETDLVLMQLEIPLSTVEFIADTAKRYDRRLVLNPAPATVLPIGLLEHVFLITPNETETEMLTGIYPEDLGSMQLAANHLLTKGVQQVVITLGSKGAFWMNSKGNGLVGAPPVTAIDTTAAGDVFNGALVTALANGSDLPTACGFACKAASISVTRMGAQASAPYLNEM